MLTLQAAHYPPLRFQVDCLPIPQQFAQIADYNHVARPLRDTAPGKVHLITTRTAQGELLLVPHPELNALIGGIIARYAEMFSIDIFAYNVLSNHYHLLAEAPEALLPRFVENLNREISHRVNRMLNRRGCLWGRRYDDQVTIEPYDELEGILYVVTNPVKHGQVEAPRLWPGLTCHKQLFDEKPREFFFTHYSEYKKAKRRAWFSGEVVRKSDYQTKHILRLSPVSIFKDLSASDRAAKLRVLIEQRTAKLYSERIAAGKGFLDRKNVLNQPRKGQFPESVNSSPRPRCYTKNPEAAAAFRREEKLKRESYRSASRQYRLGMFTIKFPEFCFLPPMHHRPKDYTLLPAPT